MSSSRKAPEKKYTETHKSDSLRERDLDDCDKSNTTHHDHARREGPPLHSDPSRQVNVDEPLDCGRNMEAAPSTQEKASHRRHTHHDHDEHSQHKDHGHSHYGGMHAPPGVHFHSPLKSITAAFFLNLFFTIIELVGGALSGSVSIFANAIHDLGDTVTLGTAFYMEKLSIKKRNERYSFGYRRFSLLSAVFSGVIIISGSVLVLKESIPRFIYPEEVKPLQMLGLAVLGVMINGWAAFRLFKGNSHHEKILTWHLVEDASGWVIVLVGAFFIHFKKWYWLDPLMATGLALFVMFNIVRNLKSTFEVFLQRVPNEFDEAKFNLFIKQIPGVAGVHDLHVWSMDGERHVLSLHLVLTSEAARNVAEIKSKIQKFVLEMGNFHTTIETEEVGDECTENCDE